MAFVKRRRVKIGTGETGNTFWYDLTDGQVYRMNSAGEWTYWYADGTRWGVGGSFHNVSLEHGVSVPPSGQPLDLPRDLSRFTVVEVDFNPDPHALQHYPTR